MALPSMPSSTVTAAAKIATSPLPSSLASPSATTSSSPPFDCGGGGGDATGGDRDMFGNAGTNGIDGDGDSASLSGSRPNCKPGVATIAGEFDWGFDSKSASEHGPKFDWGLALAFDWGLALALMLGCR